ncbi:MAG: hypothetical protein KGL39_24815 [Patescibacteria group bacterium]|nr:hypothetical protein [Patescibacteria group bacterium]
MTAETQAILESLDARFLARLKPWQDRAVKLVSSVVDDAAAHAHHAITETLRKTPDGKPTSARLRKSRSYQAALDRLDGLLTALAGPSVHSAKGLVRNARASFYRDSFLYWRSRYDRDLWVSPDPRPTKRGINRIRGALIQSADLRSTLSGPIESAKRSLGPAVTSAASQTTTKRQGKDTIDTWRSQAKSAITAAVLGALSDSDQRAHTLAALDVLAPDHLDKASLSASSHEV